MKSSTMVGGGLVLLSGLGVAVVGVNVLLDAGQVALCWLRSVFTLTGPAVWLEQTSASSVQLSWIVWSGWVDRFDLRTVTSAFHDSPALSGCWCGTVWPCQRFACRNQISWGQ
ncbi:hypothetical protein MSIMFI_03320 [Mycobacterium simulans]|uniref:hypothetical protein n=1 Tax=Mycobacterium simulans TaxID=627089 RepID=UPI00174C44D9|nr:hypothetical protein [Mycobacterium simulans]SON61801.1 hypothetical protein MSIMFI_03320 [Mycobacterium simulans]